MTSQHGHRHTHTHSRCNSMVDLCTIKCTYVPLSSGAPTNSHSLTRTHASNSGNVQLSLVQISTDMHTLAGSRLQLTFSYSLLENTDECDVNQGWKSGGKVKAELKPSKELKCSTNCPVH